MSRRNLVQKAVCVLEGVGDASGTVFVEQENESPPWKVTGEIKGLVSTSMLLESIQMAASVQPPHFNPHSKNHGGPAEAERQVGADDVAKIDITDQMLTLAGPLSVIWQNHGDPW